ncbi:MAG TPA: glycoside hydrolase family 3 C-terminal domain-containing protein [Croceibacterium sp.]|nr:glycoside hydrolase family 3 C-terminal domain-containing protein [Croceibacterium sp.]
MRAIAAVLLAGVVATGAAAQTSGSAEVGGSQCTAAEGETQPWANKSYTPECRARLALAEFRTLDEKLRFLSPPPKEKSTVRDVANVLHLPAINGSDGPAGLVRGSATALPSPLAVAASFDPAIATKYGTVLAEEFRAAGLGTILGPAFDTARTWHFGRLSESMGEDPFLAASMAGPEVRAISDHGVNATMKHYAVYNQEAGRVGDQPSGSAPTVDNIVNEKALREIYLPPFEAAVKVGGAGAVMCSFPRVNGTYACENAHLFDILKREWGFDGGVGPDFPSAQRSITRAVMAGLDSGSFAASPFNAALAHEKPLAQAVRDGDVPETRIDDMILRRLVPLFRLGQYDNPPGKGLSDVSTPEHRTTAAEILAAGTVLLKNDGGILPLGKLVRSVALIGPQAGANATVVEQGSPYVKPVHLEPVLPAVQARAGDRITVTQADGTLGLGALPPFDPAQVKTSDGEPGWRAEYFANPNLDFSAAPLANATVADPSLDKAPAIAALPANNQWSVRYTASFTPAESGVHRFTLHGSGSARLLVGGKPQAGFELADFGDAAYANLELQTGQPVSIEIDYTPRSALRDQRMTMFGLEMGLTLRVGHAPPDDLIAKAVDVAKQADIAVVFAGEQVGEGMDRSSLSLQADQDRLIEAVAAANPNTVVVLSTGGPVAMPWLGKVAAVMETWMPGDAFGPAVAAMLFGDAEPAGRLPVTFPADETQGPGTQRADFPGVTDPATGRLEKAHFDEGVNVGYRFWDAHDQQPLFPFGFGLGYGDVTMEGLGIADGAEGAKVVRVHLHNTGERATSAVPEIYLGFPPAANDPPKQLKGFARVLLQPGEERDVDISLSPAAFRFWDADKAAWASGGTYDVMLGSSSRDIVWHQAVEAPGG